MLSRGGLLSVWACSQWIHGILCCWLHWKPFKPFLLPRDGMSRQTAAGWAQQLFETVFASSPPTPGCLLATGVGTWAILPGCLWEETDRPVAFVCCSCWKCSRWLNTAMKSKWIIVMQDRDRDYFGWAGWSLSLPWDNPCLSSQFSLLWLCTHLENSRTDCTEIIWQHPPHLLFSEIITDLTDEQDCTNFDLHTFKLPSLKMKFTNCTWNVELM